MNEYYKLLVQFQTGEKITYHRLLRLPGVTAELVNNAEKQGYIQRATPTDDGDVRYMITQKGKEKRDN